MIDSKESMLFLLVKALAVLAVSSVLISDIAPRIIADYAGQRLLLVFVCGLLAIFCLSHTLATFRSCRQSVYYPVLPSFLLSSSFLLLAMPYAGAPYVWVEPGMYAFFFSVPVLLAFYLAQSGRIGDYLQFIPHVAAVGCFLYGAMSVNVYIFALLDGVTRIDYFIPWGFVNIRYWSHIASWLIPLLSLAVLTGPLKHYRLWRWIVAIGAALWWWIMLMSSSRGSALGLLLAFLLVSLVIGRSALPWVKSFVFYFFLGILAWLLLSIFLPSLLTEEVQLRSIKSHGSGRLPLFAEAWVMSFQNFPLGMGPQSWLTHPPLTEAYQVGRKFGHPHNMYLMWAAEYGWLLIVALLCVTGQAIRKFWTKRSVIRENLDSSSAIMLAGFTASVSAALVHAGVSAVFIAPGSMLVGLFVLAGFWGLILCPGTKEKSSVITEESMKHKLFRWFVVLLLALSWFGWAREVVIYQQAMEADLNYYREELRGSAMPRFWLHGQFPRFE